MRRLLMILFCLMIAVVTGILPVMGQSKQSVVSGTVVSASDGQPVIGATVKVKGSEVATITDTNGKFSLKGLKAGQKLEISYVGMQTKTVSLPREGRGVALTVSLDDDASVLDEVIVTAFGEQKRSAFTGSAAVIDSKNLEKKQLTNVLSGLQGEAAGVQMTTGSAPTDAPTIRIRGFSSINADNDPLIIVDGSYFEGQWNDINPADVESVTVLKDAASAALYGARGANGVIMITTKKAKVGDATITVDAKWGANSRIRRDYETIKNVGQYYETYYKALYNYYTNAKNLSPSDAFVSANETLGASSSAGGLGYITMTVPQGEYLIGNNGRLNPNATIGNIITSGGNSYLITPDNWLDEATRIGFRQEYNINANGGSDRMQYYASFGYLNTKGVTIGSDFERYTVRFKATYQVKKWLRLGGNANYTHSKADYISTSSNNLFSVCQNIAPIYPVYIRDASGNILNGIGGKLYDYGDGEKIGLVRSYQTGYNPIQEATLNTYNGKTNSFGLDGFAEVTPLEGLKITLKGNVTDVNQSGNYGYNPYYGWSADAYSGGQVSLSKAETYSYNFQELVDYRRSFGKHNAEVLVGHENFRRTYDYLYGTKQGVASYLTNQTLAGAVTVVGTGSTTGSSDGSNATGYNTEGWFFRGLYDYNSKYYGNVSIRRDASSRFHPDHRWGAFYSFGGAWVMTEESWLQGQASWLNSLKLKASYGQVGNDAIGDFRYMNTFKIVNSDGNVGVQVATIGNPDITWETVGNFNIGVEFELFNGRLSGDIEYFTRKTTDMLCLVRVPVSAGYAGSYHNIGDMTNNGVEMSFNVGIVKTKDFQWNFNVNATLYRNRITKIAQELKSKNLGGHAGYDSGSYYYGEGLPMYTLYMPKYAGVNVNGQSTWYTRDDDGNVTGTTTKYSEASNFITDDPNPDVYGGFGTSLSWKGFDLSISCAYSIGGKAYDYGYAALMTNPTFGSSGYAIHKDMLNAWSTTNTTSDIPRWQFGDNDTAGMSDRFLTNASWLTLSNINLGYTLPSKIVRKLYMSKIRVYVSGENLYYWSARKGFDPRTSFNGTASTSSYSPSRTISGGITVTF